jgi:hypothetical protein
LVFFSFGNSQRQTALAEIETFDDFGVFLALFVFVFAYNAYICNAAGNCLRNVVVTLVEKFYRKILGWHQQGAFARFYLDARF